MKVNSFLGHCSCKTYLKLNIVDAVGIVSFITINKRSLQQSEFIYLKYKLCKYVIYYKFTGKL